VSLLPRLLRYLKIRILNLFPAVRICTL